MNLTKKLFSYIVAIAMIFTLTAFAGGAVNAAETTYKLTLNGQQKDILMKLIRSSLVT